MPRLLFITQKVDKDDDVLGTYHRWIEEFAGAFSSIEVVCLSRGTVDLPGNVRVYSLGKETQSDTDLRGWKRGFTRIKYIYRFYKYIWSLRKKYRLVFVHMNPVYIILGGLFWRSWRKPIFLWYNHPFGSWKTKLAIYFSQEVFCTSPYSFSAKYKKTSLMPAGIDTDFFRPMQEISKNKKQILCLGRISPIKKIEYLIEAAKILDNKGLDFKVLIVGSPSSSKIDKEYELKLKSMSVDLLSKGKIEFRPAVPNYSAPVIYNSAGVFVNLTPTGSLDKTILEAMACSTVVLVSNKIFMELFPGFLRELCLFEEGNIEDCAIKMQELFKLNEADKKHLSQELRNLVVTKHSLDTLICKLFQEFDYENKRTVIK